MTKQYTTETLRCTLFDAIEQVKSHKMDLDDAKTIAVLADRIIKTAELEIKYSETCSKLDKEEQGISPGPLMLVNKTTEESP